MNPETLRLIKVLNHFKKNILADAEYLSTVPRINLLTFWDVLKFKYRRVSGPPDGDEYRICVIDKDFEYYSATTKCFHFVIPKQVLNAYCVYIEEYKVLIRKHEIGRCPDSKYTKELKIRK
jgi:hypothetical protein